MKIKEFIKDKKLVEAIKVLIRQKKESVEAGEIMSQGNIEVFINGKKCEFVQSIYFEADARCSELCPIRLTLFAGLEIEGNIPKENITTKELPG